MKKDIITDEMIRSDMKSALARNETQTVVYAYPKKFFEYEKN